MKTYRVVLTYRAKGDIQQAIKWYNKKQSGLGRKFHLKLLQAVDIIQKNPLFAIRYDDIRCYKVHRFPYLIHYLLQNDSIYILAVIHTSQNPDEHWFSLKGR